jgi:hypothetical protein
MEDLINLQLINNISKEIENHLGILDKTLAEFIVEMLSKAKIKEEFKDMLKNACTALPDPFVDKLFAIKKKFKPFGRTESKMSLSIPCSGQKNVELTSLHFKHNKKSTYIPPISLKGLSGVKKNFEDNLTLKFGKKITSPERFEIKQLLHPVRLHPMKCLIFNKKMN